MEELKFQIVIFESKGLSHLSTVGPINDENRKLPYMTMLRSEWTVIISPDQMAEKLKLFKI